MGKKRKVASRSTEDKGPNLDAGESRKRIKTYEDVADSDDEFHIQRDKVLLDEGPEAKRRRKLLEEEEFLELSEDEVLDFSEEDENEEYDAPGAYAGAEEDGLSDDEEDAAGDSDDEQDLRGWGTSKEALYGADAIETEQDALDEEAEALRLQKKQLQAMTAADYAFDEGEWQGTSKIADEVEDKAVITEVLPQLQITEDMGLLERLKLLKGRYPEFEPLSKELLALQDVHSRLLAEASSAKSNTSSSAPVVVTKYRAATAYLGALTMYFALLSSPTGDGVAMSATKLRDHPVMDSLVRCRELWVQVQALPDDELTRESLANGPATYTALSNGTKQSKAKTGKADHYPRKSRAERHAEAVKAAEEARRAEKLARTEADLADLDALIKPSALKEPVKAKAKQQASKSGDDSDLGEEPVLTAHEAAEKAQRKKSLRFYTSQISQKANKRGAAGRNAGGDDDIPYRERLKDREARLNAEAEKRGKKQGTDPRTDLGGESDDDDREQGKAIRDDAEDDGYYDLIASRTAKKKSEKRGLAEAQKQAALHGGEVVQAESVGEDGKRKISYLIEKNKGLTPHRKKEVRNPRVKKRKKYEEKKKKLASIKPVYKGGEGRGGYGGELTGIKKGLVKSTKL